MVRVVGNVYCLFTFPDATWCQKQDRPTSLQLLRSTSRRNGLNRRIDPSNRTRILHTCVSFARPPVLLEISTELNRAHSWEKWKQKFKIYLKVIGAAKKPDEMKVGLLLLYYYCTAAWLAQLVERQSAVREVDGSRTLGVLKYLRRMCCLCNYISKWLDIQVFSDKDYKPQAPSSASSVLHGQQGTLKNLHTCRTEQGMQFPVLWSICSVIVSLYISCMGWVGD